MLKLIDLDSSFFKEEPVITILDSELKLGLIKKASDSRVSNFVSSMEKRPDRVYVHILAMGAGEYFGANRNADFFPEENLLKYFKTFETSPAHIFKHHINKDPSIAMGQVIFAIYNERMHRVEVIAWVDKARGAEYIRRLELGEFPATSMACHTPFDTCSICGNKARSRSEYCLHLSTQLGKVYPDGRKVMAINDGPLKFFDMSFVFKPADITSGVLQKVASAEDITSGVLQKVASAEDIISSIELAELAGLSKESTLKLSSLIKEIEGEVVGFGSLSKILNKVRDPDDAVINFLIHYDIDHVLHAFADLGISPSVSFFAKLIGQKLCGEDVNEITKLVDQLLKDDEYDPDISKLDVDSKSSQPKSAIISSLVPYIKQASLFPEQIMGRVLNPDGSVYSRQSNIGFAGNGPLIQDGDPEKEAFESYQKLKNSATVNTNSKNLLSTLFQIAGAAIAAKWLITKMIDQKMQDYRNSQENHPTPIKIVLVKTAEDALTTQQLVKASLLYSLKKKQ